jgi:hypothetical protein
MPEKAMHADMQPAAMEDGELSFSQIVESNTLPTFTP